MILIKDLTKRYKSKNKKICTALDGIDLVLPDKGMIFVIGKSGSGKSTLLNMIGGLDSFDEGTIISGGNDLSTFKGRDFYKYRASHVGFIFQDFHLIEELTVAENIRLSSEIANAENEDIERALSEVDLEGYGDRYPAELSGGEKQRVVIARALIKSPDIILCDEPAGNLDNNTSAGIMELLHSISKDRLVLIVSHDMPDAEKYGDRIIELSKGRIINDFSKREGYSSELSIENGVLTLPYNRNLTDDDIEFIKSSHRDSPIHDLKQSDGGYEKTGEIKKSDRITALRSSKMRAKSIFKLFGAFTGAGKVKLATTAMISSVLMVLLIILQSFLTFDGTRAVSGVLEDESSVVALRKSVYTTSAGDKHTEWLNYITDEDMSALKESGGRNLKTYTLYSYCLPIYFNTFSSPVEEEQCIADKFGHNNIYTDRMYGTLACDEEYLIERFGVDGELIVLAGDINRTKSDGSIIITDYIADAMVNASSFTYETILNYNFKQSGLSVGQVAAIIYTGYKEKYADEIAIMAENKKTNVMGIELLELSDMTRIVRDATTNLAIGYTLNEDFVYATASLKYRDFVRTNGFFFVHSEDSERFHEYDGIILVPRTYCKKGDIYLSTRAFSSLSGSVFDLVTGDNNSIVIPGQEDYYYKFRLKRHEFPALNSQLVYDNEFTVMGLLNLREAHSHISYEDFYELTGYDIIPYAVYIDGYSNIDEVMEAMEPRGFVWPAAENEVITFLTDSVNMFTDLFKMLEIITLAVIVVFLISYGISNIRKNYYQIGVIKAMGGRSGDIAKIFLLQNLVITAIICIVSYVGALLLVDEANQLVLTSFEAIVEAKFGQLTIIAFSNELLLNAFLMTLALGVISTIIPIIILHCIKPIKIIKAME